MTYADHMQHLVHALTALDAPLRARPYDGWRDYVTDDVTLEIPYWIENKDELATDMPVIVLGPVKDWRVSHCADGTDRAIREQFEEEVAS